MSKKTDRDTNKAEGSSDHSVAQSVGTNYKVLGENESTDGTPVGVEGRVPNADGYGLATPGDAKIEGDLLLSALAGGIAGGNRLMNLAGSGLSISGGELTVPTLPRYTSIGDDPQGVIDTMSQLFTETAWAEVSYSTGPTHGEGGDAFYGAVVAPTGEVIFVPWDADHIGIYDPTTGTYTTGPAHNEGDAAFFGGALAPTGEVILAPSNSSYVGIYDPDTNSYRRGASVLGDTFEGAVLAPTGEIVFPPWGDYIGVYDPVADEYNRGPSPSSPDNFSSAALAPTGEVVFTPWDGQEIGIYDPSTNDYREVSHSEPADMPLYFFGAATAPTGEVIFAPALDSISIGIFDPVTDTYISGPSPGSLFTGAVLAPTGDVILLPGDSSTPVGIYDPDSRTYRSGPDNNGDDLVGGVLTPNGRIVCAPSGTSIGIIDMYAQLSRAHVTTTHPLLNNF